MDCATARGPTVPASSVRLPPLGGGAHPRLRSRLSSLALSFRQTDVDRRGLFTAHVDLRGVAAIPILPNLDAVRSSSELNHERLFGRPLPALAVDQDLGVRRLDTNCQRAVSLDARGITFGSGCIRRIGWFRRLARPGVGRLTRRKRRHLIADTEGGARANEDGLRDLAMSVEVQRQIVLAWLDVQALEPA